MDAPARSTSDLRKQAFVALGAMLAWGADFLLRYAIAWLACVAGWADIEILGVSLLYVLLFLLTILAGAVAIAAGLAAWRLWREVDAVSAGTPPDQRAASDPVARTRFLALWGLMMSALFLFGILLLALPGLFLPPCW